MEHTRHHFGRRVDTDVDRSCKIRGPCLPFGQPLFSPVCSSLSIGRWGYSRSKPNPVLQSFRPGRQSPITGYPCLQQAMVRGVTSAPGHFQRTAVQNGSRYADVI